MSTVLSQTQEVMEKISNKLEEGLKIIFFFSINSPFFFLLLLEPNPDKERLIARLLQTIENVDNHMAKSDKLMDMMMKKMEG